MATARNAAAGAVNQLIRGAVDRDELSEFDAALIRVNVQDAFNIQGDVYAQDGSAFADKVAEALRRRGFEARSTFKEAD